MIITKRLSVTLTNGRGHMLLLPESVDVREAADVLCGIRSGSEIGWPEGDGTWLRFDEGDGWLRRDAIAEVAVVDSVLTPTEIY
jgi:hypothetical protein